jgi:bacterioferritin
VTGKHYDNRQSIRKPDRSPTVQGLPEVIEALNRALTIELTAINQYFCQSRMCKNWGFMKLAAKHYEESIGEMKHADKLIERVLFLDGVPEIARYDVIRVGSNVKEQFENDLKLETGGVKAYNELVDLCIRLKDNGTHKLALEILADSEEHVDWLETQLGLIATVGLERYLAEQMTEEEEGE